MLLMNPLSRITGRTAPVEDLRPLKRLEFEMALDLGGRDKKLGEAVRAAAESAGGELLFVLPSRVPGESALVERAVVHIPDEGRSHFLQVRIADGAFVVTN